MGIVNNAFRRGRHGNDTRRQSVWSAPYTAGRHNPVKPADAPAPEAQQPPQAYAPPAPPAPAPAPVYHYPPAPMPPAQPQPQPTMYYQPPQPVAPSPQAAEPAPVAPPPVRKPIAEAQIATPAPPLPIAPEPVTPEPQPQPEPEPLPEPKVQAPPAIDPGELSMPAAPAPPPMPEPELEPEPEPEPPVEAAVEIEPPAEPVAEDVDVDLHVDVADTTPYYPAPQDYVDTIAGSPTIFDTQSIDEAPWRTWQPPAEAAQPEPQPQPEPIAQAIPQPQPAPEPIAPPMPQPVASQPQVEPVAPPQVEFAPPPPISAMPPAAAPAPMPMPMPAPVQPINSIAAPPPAPIIEAPTADIADMPVAAPIPGIDEADQDIVIPAPHPGAGHYAPEIVVHHDRGSVVTEQYRAIRLQILARCRNRKLQVHVITSSAPNEGKTVTSVNLAMAFAELQNKKTLLIEGDLRRPSLQGVIGQKQSPGLLHLLRGQINDIDQAIHPSPYDNVHILPAGDYGTTSSTELLSNHTFPQILDQLRERYDHIFIDTPPVISVTDACIFGSLADEVLLVVRLGSTPVEVVDRTKRLLRASNCEVAGVILTHMRYHIPKYLYRYV